MGILQMLGVGGGGPQQLDPIPTDIIYPSHTLDDVPNLRQLVLSFSFKFNDVLDPPALQNALSRLLDIGDWRKLGGRVRTNAKGRLEYHVPETFTDGRPAVAYSHERVDMNIADHPAGSKYLECDGISRTFADVPELVPLSRSSTSPKNLSDYLTSDHPLIALRITSFNDATIIGLLWPHILMDIIGQAELLQAWSLVLAGNEDQVRPLKGARRDIAWDAGDPDVPAKEDWKMLQNKASTFGYLVLICRILWTSFFGPQLSARSFIMTKAALENLVTTARSEINGAFVSEGDVLTAWITKISNVAEGRVVDYTILQILNLRYRLPALVQDGTYITNFALPAGFLWTSQFIRDASIGELALDHRRNIQEQGTEEQALGFLRCIRECNSHTPRREPPLLIEPTADLFTFTNWEKSKIIQTPDFSPAIIRPGDTSDTRSNPPGTMVTFDQRRQEANVWFKGSTVILGKDHSGNCWMWSIMPESIWNALDEALRKLD